MLVRVENNEIVTSSLKVAEVFAKEHENVLQGIDNLIERASDELKFQLLQLFRATVYTDAHGENRREILMNRDGFSLLAMDFTGEKTLKWKIDFINAFNSMENAVKATKITGGKLKAEARLAEAINARHKLWLELSDRFDAESFKQICLSYAANTLAGCNVLPLPRLTERTLSATEVIRGYPD